MSDSPKAPVRPVFTPRVRVTSLDELNAWLLDKCLAFAAAHRHPEEGEKTIWEVFEAGPIWR